MDGKDLVERMASVRKRLADLRAHPPDRLPDRPARWPELLDDLGAAMADVAEADSDLRREADQLRERLARAEADVRHYRELFESAPDGYVVTDPAGRVRQANRAAGTMLEVDPAVLAGRTMRDFVAPEDRDCFDAALARTTCEASAAPVEFVLRTSAARAFPAAVALAPVCDPGGAVMGLRWALRDVTDRDRAARALADSQAFLQRVIDAIPEHLVVIDLDQRVVLANAAARAGDVDPVLAGLRCYELSHARTARCEGEADACPLRTIVETKAPMRVTHTHTTAAGEERVVEVTAAPVFSPGGEVVRVIEACRDVTDRTRAEAERADMARFPNENPDPVLRVRADGTLLFANAASRPLLDHWNRSVGERVPATFRRTVRTVDQAGEAADVELRARGRVYALRVVPVEAAGWVNVYGRDVTWHRLAEESRRRLASIVESSDDAIVSTTLGGAVVSWNPAAETLFGYAADAVMGRPLALLWPEDRSDEVPEALGRIRAGTRIEAVETRLRTREGAPVEVSLSFFPIPDAEGEVVGASAIIRDVTERRRAEERHHKLEARLQHAQRLESLGTLAGGIAHDFNNILTAILGNADVVAHDIEADHPARDPINEIRKASLRAAELVNQMLAYSGRGQFLVEACDLGGLVREMAELLGASVSKHTELRLKLAAGLPPVEVDATQLRQVVMNLITNASEALGEAPGTVTLWTGITYAGGAVLTDALGGEALEPGRYVYLRVEDTGCGMDEATCVRVFEPFFTTKFAGRGLGLAATLGIIRGHRGAIRLRSRPGEGTTFEVLLPPARLRRRPPPRLKREPEREGGETTARPVQGSTVLVIDDEDAVRGSARRMLVRHGAKVLMAADGRQGVRVFRKHADQVDLVLLDLTMPRMSSDAVFRALRKVRPDVPVLLASGYSQSDAAARFAGLDLAGFVRKPFQMSTLIAQVRAAMTD